MKKSSLSENQLSAFSLYAGSILSGISFLMQLFLSSPPNKGEHIFMNSYVDLCQEGESPRSKFLVSDTSRSSQSVNTGVKVEEVELEEALGM